MRAPLGLGSVTDLWVYPVKSLQGVRLPAVHVDAEGLRGDRAFVVQALDGSGPVTARTAPALREVLPVLAPGGAGVGVLAPGASEPAFGADADAVLSELVGRAVRVHDVGSGAGHDVAAVHLVSSAAVRAAEGAVAEGCSVEDPRANLRLDLVEAAGSERDHVGAVVSAGGAVLRLTRPPKHCLGVYAEVVAPGPLAVGDPLVLA